MVLSTTDELTDEAKRQEQNEPTFEFSVGGSPIMTCRFLINPLNRSRSDATQLARPRRLHPSSPSFDADHITANCHWYIVRLHLCSQVTLRVPQFQDHRLLDPQPRLFTSKTPPDHCVSILGRQRRISSSKRPSSRDSKQDNIASQ